MLNDIVPLRREEPRLVGHDEILTTGLLIKVVDEQDPHTGRYGAMAPSMSCPSDRHCDHGWDPFQSQYDPVGDGT